MIMKKRIGELSEKIILQNVYYRKHLGMLERYAEKVLIILNEFNCIVEAVHVNQCTLEERRNNFLSPKSQMLREKPLGQIIQTPVHVTRKRS